MADNRKYVQAQPFTLGGSGVSAGDATVNLTSFLGIDGTPLTMSDFGTKGFGTCEPGSSTQEEQISFTGVTQNADGSATLTGVSTVSFVSPYTETANFGKDHAGGTIFVISNTSGFYNSFANKEDDETIAGLWQFPNNANTPTLGSSYVAPTLPQQVASKGYVDSVAVSGAPNADTVTKGIVQIATGAQLAAGTGTGSTGAVIVPAGSSFKNTTAGAGDTNKIPVLDTNGVLDQTFLGGARTWNAVQSFTADNLQVTTDANSSNDAVRYSMLQTVVSVDIPKGAISGTSGEAITAGQGVYIKASDSKLYRTVATGDESTYSFVGVAVTTVAGADLTVQYAPPGHIVTGLVGLTAGSSYYVTDSAGTLGTTPGTRYAKVGRALSTTILQVSDPKFIAKGTTTFSSASSTVITTGFYPANIVINAAFSTVIDSTQYQSFGDDSNRCIYAFRAGAGEYKAIPDATKAWLVSYGASAGTNQGTVSAKSATGFTLTCDNASASNQATIQWTAYSE